MEKIIQFGATYKDIFLPIINTVLTIVVLPVLGFGVKKKLNQSAIKAELQLEALKNVANREDNKPELENVKNGLSGVIDKVVLLAEMFDKVFQNSIGLNEDVKNDLKVLSNKLKHNTSDELIVEMGKELEKVKDQLNASLKKPTIVPVKAEKPKKKNRLGR